MKAKSIRYWDCGWRDCPNHHTDYASAHVCALGRIESFVLHVCPVCGQKFTYEDMAEECCDIELMQKKIEAIEAKEKADFGDKIHIRRMRERIEQVGGKGG